MSFWALGVTVAMLVVGVGFLWRSVHRGCSGNASVVVVAPLVPNERLEPVLDAIEQAGCGYCHIDLGRRGWWYTDEWIDIVVRRAQSGNILGIIDSVVAVWTPWNEIDYVLRSVYQKQIAGRSERAKRALRRYLQTDPDAQRLFAQDAVTWARNTCIDRLSADCLIVVGDNKRETLAGTRAASSTSAIGINVGTDRVGAERAWGFVMDTKCSCGWERFKLWLRRCLRRGRA